jgi:NAD(P)H-dependent FMN reductase
MVNIGVVVGSTRPNRKALEVAEWVLTEVSTRTDATFELLDLAAFELPLLDEPVPPSQGNYTKAHTRTWSARVQACDGFVFVTPEYNHGISGALKNAIDFLYVEWNNKAAAFVSYGSAGGSRAVEQLRLVMGELQIADVRAQVMLPFATDFDGERFTPSDDRRQQLQMAVDQLVAWSEAMRGVRTKHDWIAAS